VLHWPSADLGIATVSNGEFTSIPDMPKRDAIRPQTHPRHTAKSKPALFGHIGRWGAPIHFAALDLLKACRHPWSTRNEQQHHLARSR
jgi:hypothetical protein